jgi:hypothetical protein
MAAVVVAREEEEAATAPRSTSGAPAAIATSPDPDSHGENDASAAPFQRPKHCDSGACAGYFSTSLASFARDVRCSAFMSRI